MKFSELMEIVTDSVGQEYAQKLARDVCVRAGGESVYIPKIPTPVILQTDTVKDVQRRHGVSRSTAYNWVASWRK